MKKILISIISFIILIIICLFFVLIFKQENMQVESNKIQIIATLFPQYDFAKHIVGDKADVKLLLNSGVETHNYEPTPKDMLYINKSNLFLYNGEELEPWTKSIINSIDSNCKIINISEGIDLIKIEDFEKRYINGSNYNIEDHNDESHHEEIYDEHIWLNPSNAIIMIDNITKAICEIDGKNEAYYKENSENYKNEILNIDNEFKEFLKEAPRKEIAVGGEFAYAYLIEKYDLNFVSVYNNCGEGEDPSITKVKSVIDYINQKEIPVVFYEELTEGTVAKMIAEETKAKSLILYSIHNANIEKDTYVSLFKKNIENLKEALSN